MKCAECGESNASYQCNDCGSWYCKECAEIFEEQCDCRGPNIFYVGLQKYTTNKKLCRNCIHYKKKYTYGPCLDCLSNNSYYQNKNFKSKKVIK